MSEMLDQWAREHVWFPFSRPGEISGETSATILTRGEGVTVTDDKGNDLLDAVGAMEAMAVGHGQQRLIDAATRQLQELSFIDTFRYTSKPAIELAHRLAVLAPGDLNRVHYTAGGSEAVEVALKLAIQYHYLRGQPNRRQVIVRNGAFHGVTFGAMNCDGGYHATRNDIYLGDNRFGHSAAPTSESTSWGSGSQYASGAAEIRETVIKLGPETVAAVVVDPAATASGVAVPPGQDLIDLRHLCDEFGILLIVDEVITGFCRTGDWFLSSKYGVTPDLMPVSKALSSGYMPIGATLVSARVEQAFLEGDPRDTIFAHGQTFGAHPVACAVAIENLNIMEEGDYCSRANEMGDYLRSKLSSLADLECFVDIRGLGMVNGLEVKAPASSALSNKEAATFLRRDLRRRGLIAILVHPGNVFLITPPIVTQESDIDTMADIFRDSLEALEIDGPR